MGLFNWAKKKKETFEDFPAIGGLMISKKVIEEGLKPLFMYREKRSRPEDSGWRIFSGFESDEYTNDPNNTGIYNPSTLLKMDDSVADLLLKGVGSVFERKDQNSDWYSVNDYPLEDDYMVSHNLTENWTIEINNLFERIKEENGDLLYTTEDKSVRIAIWNMDGEAKDEIYKNHQEQVNNRNDTESLTLDSFEFSDEQVYRIGYLVKENDDQKEYSVIYGFSIIDAQVIQLAFYFDNQSDRKWAIETWKEIKLK
ncbi:MAG: hypothetical protein ACI8ZM_005483 [Crocinitomix sp.]|jgi:hypothetical protein